MSTTVETRRPPARSSAVGNGIWSAVQQSLVVLSSAIFSVLLIAHLPVAQYGIYSYATSMASIGVSVMSAGLSGLAVKALVNQPDRNRSIVTGLIVVRELFALLGYGILILLSLTSGDRLNIAATALASLVLFARAFDAPEMWFVSRLRGRKAAVIRIGVTIAMLGTRLLALLTTAGVLLFLVLFVLEATLAAGLITVRYLRDPDGPGLGRPDRTTPVGLMGQSWPLMLSGLANQLNLKGDVVVIQAVLGASAVGVYAAAARLSEIAYFLPVVFMNATFPALLQLRKRVGPEHHEYRAALQRSYDQSFWAGVSVALGVGFAGSWLISHLFGPAYQQAVPVLWISLGACPFVFMAAVYSKWIIAEGILWSSLVRHGCGAAVNLVANLLLLPRLGIVGSALASLVSYVIASYLACFVGRRSRQAGWQMTLALVAPVRLLLNRYRKDPTS